MDFGALQLIILESNHASMLGKRLEAFWIYAKDICGSLRDSKDLIRDTGMLRSSLFAYLNSSVDDSTRDILCDFLTYSCAGNNSNRQLLAASKVIDVVLMECSDDALSCERRIKLCNLLAAVCSQDDNTGSSHVSVWSRDKLM